MNNSSLTKSEVDSFHSKYESFNLENTFQSHFQAAFYTPTQYLEGMMNFEATIDLILFHLENAYRAASSDEEIQSVQISAQWLVNFHLDVIETGIELEKSRNRIDYKNHVMGSIPNLALALGKYLYTDELDLSILVPETGKLFGAYYEFLTNKKQLKIFREQFYHQLLHIYTKLLDSETYSSDLKLMKNSLMRVDKQKLLDCALQEKGLAITTGMLLKFQLSESDLGQYLRVLVQNLDKALPQPSFKDMMQLVKFFRDNNFPNKQELERDVVQFFELKTLPAFLRSQGITASLEALKESVLEKEDLGQSLRILLNNIDKVSPQPSTKDLMILIEFFRGQELPNRRDLERDVVQFFQLRTLPTILRTQGLAAALRTLQESVLEKEDLEQSLRHVISNLEIGRNSEQDLVSIMEFAIKERLLNANEIKMGILDFYKRTFEPKRPGYILPVILSFFASLILYIVLVVSGFQSNQDPSAGFFQHLGRALVSSVPLSFGFLVLTIGLILIIRGLIISSRGNAFSNKLKKFEKELENVIPT